MSGAISVTVSAAAAGLVALSLTMAAPASADGPHHGHRTGDGHTTSDTGGHGAHESDASAQRREAAAPSASASSTPDRPVFPTGHDKCRKTKHRRLLPWCADPGAGWLGETTLRGVSTGKFSRDLCLAARYQATVGCHGVRREQLDEVHQGKR
jgi:hypothetical protein